MMKKGRETQRIGKLRKEKQAKFNLKLLREKKKNIKPTIQTKLEVFL